MRLVVTEQKQHEPPSWILFNMKYTVIGRTWDYTNKPIHRILPVARSTTNFNHIKSLSTARQRAGIVSMIFKIHTQAVVQRS